MKSVTVTRPSLQKFGVANGESVSKNLQIDGNAFFENGQLCEALECYNKSLCVAQSNSNDISLAYECKSAVYLKANEYQMCMDNIELAISFCDDTNRVKVLNEQIKLCKDLIRYDQHDFENEPWNFFKLSYPANKQIPFIVDCLELHNNKKFGRFIITNQGNTLKLVIALADFLTEFYIFFLHRPTTRRHNCY